MSQKSDEKRRIFMGLAERKKSMPKGIREKKTFREMMKERKKKPTFVSSHF